MKHYGKVVNNELITKIIVKVGATFDLSDYDEIPDWVNIGDIKEEDGSWPVSEISYFTDDLTNLVPSSPLSEEEIDEILDSL